MPHTEPLHSEPEDWIGRKVDGKYRVIRIVGRGGMGAVYEAENLTLGKRVALKFIDVEAAKNTDGIQRFIREARAASTIESAHIVQVFDVGELEDGRPFIVMELLRGENLGAHLQRVGRLTVADALHVAVHVLHGLRRAHEAGIVHRDLKPENIFLVDTDDDPMFAKIVDFGISKITHRSKTLEPGTITQEGVVLGTPYYMAPEQAQALPDLDGRADLWSLGAILFECMAGTRPFTGNTYEQVIIAICTEPVGNLLELAPHVPEPVARVIEQALTRDREDRFVSADAFLGALHAAAPDLVKPGPASSEGMAHTPAETAAPSTGPRTDVSWSSAGAPIAEGIRKEAPGTRSFAKLALAGSATALLAFALTVGIISRLGHRGENSGENSGGQSADSAPPGWGHAAGTTSSGARPATDPTSSAASATASSAPLPIASASESAAPPRIPASPRIPKSPGSTPDAGSGSLTGGLELKTELP